MIAAVSAAPAHAYEFGGDPWPQETITIYGARGISDTVIVRAARAWNRARVGVRFRRSTRRRADVIVRSGGSYCGGNAPVGYLFGARSNVEIGTACGTGLTTLTLVHELGHVLGLDHERDRCALMNPFADQDGTPNRCSSHSLRFWLRSPLRRDDIRGARALYLD